MGNGTENGSEPIAPGRALVPASPPAGSRDVRPLAGFTTQLIACAKDLAPYRKRRRAEPEGAAAQYEARNALPLRAQRFEQRF